MKALYVRSATLRYSDGSEDAYTSFWSTRDAQWSDLSAAAVYTEDEVKSYRVIERDGRDHGFVRLQRGDNEIDSFVPVEGEFTRLPDNLRVMSFEEMFA